MGLFGGFRWTLSLPSPVSCPRTIYQTRPAMDGSAGRGGVAFSLFSMFRHMGHLRHSERQLRASTYGCHLCLTETPARLASAFSYLLLALALICRAPVEIVLFRKEQPWRLRRTARPCRLCWHCALCAQVRGQEARSRKERWGKESQASRLGANCGFSGRDRYYRYSIIAAKGILISVWRPQRKTEGGWLELLVQGKTKGTKLKTIRCKEEESKNVEKTKRIKEPERETDKGKRRRPRIRQGDFLSFRCLENGRRGGGKRGQTRKGQSRLNRKRRSQQRDNQERGTSDEPEKPRPNEWAAAKVARDRRRDFPISHLL